MNAESAVGRFLAKEAGRLWELTEDDGLGSVDLVLESLWETLSDQPEGWLLERLLSSVGELLLGIDYERACRLACRGEHHEMARELEAHPDPWGEHLLRRLLDEGARWHSGSPLTRGLQLLLRPAQNGWRSVLLTPLLLDRPTQRITSLEFRRDALHGLPQGLLRRPFLIDELCAPLPAPPGLLPAELAPLGGPGEASRSDVVDSIGSITSQDDLPIWWDESAELAIGAWRVRGAVRPIDGASVTIVAEGPAGPRRVLLRALPWPAEPHRQEALRGLLPLAHSGLPRVLASARRDDTAWLISETSVGAPLSELITARTALPPAEVASIGCRILAVLDYAHRQSPPVLHLHLTPQRIRLAPSGRIQLLDFEPAGPRPAPGTPHPRPWLAPELAQGSPDARSDLFSLALILASLLTGRRIDRRSLFEAAWSHLRAPDPALHALLDRASRRSPAERPPNAASLRAALRPLCRAAPAFDDAI